MAQPAKLMCLTGPPRRGGLSAFSIKQARYSRDHETSRGPFSNFRIVLFFSYSSISNMACIFKISNVHFVQ